MQYMGGYFSTERRIPNGMRGIMMNDETGDFAIQFSYAPQGFSPMLPIAVSFSSMSSS
jgi:hypothetical protein